MHDPANDAHNDRPDADKHPPEIPPAGPHAKPELTDNEKTPGTGSLPDDSQTDGDVGPD